MSKGPLIIFLNGVPNAGKSSVARVLQSKINNSVHLEVDLLRSMYEWMPLADAIGVATENAKSIIPNFIKRGMNVIVDYPLDPYWHRYLLEGLPQDLKVYTFTLKPQLEVVAKNRGGGREISPELSERIKFLYNTDMYDPSLGTFIDNSELSAEATAAIILKKIGLDL